MISLISIVKHITICSTILVLASGCASYTGKDVINDHKRQTEELQREISKLKDKHEKSASSHVQVDESNYGQVTRLDKDDELRKKASWLDKKVSINVKKPMTGQEILKMFREKGINLITNLPIDQYIYRGYGVKNVSVEEAIKSILTQIGLDYKINYYNKTVEVVPMTWKTYSLNINPRSSEFVTDVQAESVGSQASFTESEGDGEEGVKRSSEFVLETKEAFWDTLEEELLERMKIMVPVKSKAEQIDSQDTSADSKEAFLESLNTTDNSNESSAKKAEDISKLEEELFEKYDNGEISENKLDQELDKLYNGEEYEMAQQGESASTQFVSDGEEYYTEVTVGKVATNKETGAVHVQAPSWVQKDIKDYIEKVKTKYNTQITFEGYLVQVSVDSSKRRALDISTFADHLKKYDVAFQNNALGGITVNEPSKDGFGKIVSDKDIGSGSLAGLYEKDNSAGVFLGFLDNIGKLSTIERPRLTTTSGIPSMFRKTITEHYNIVTQNASGGEDVGAVATENILVPVELGTMIVVSPSYDPDSGIVRSQLSISQTRKVNTQTIEQVIGEAVDTLNVEVPVISENNYNGEIVIRDNDTIIVGGHTQDSSELTDNGMPDIKDTSLGLLTGGKSQKKTTKAYYFVMNVKMDRK